MDKMFEALKGVNVNLNSADLIGVAQYWFWNGIINNVFSTISWIAFLFIVVWIVKSFLNHYKD